MTEMDQGTLRNMNLPKVRDAVSLTTPLLVMTYYSDTKIKELQLVHFISYTFEPKVILELLSCFPAEPASSYAYLMV